VIISIVRVDAMLRYHLGLNENRVDSTFYSPVPVILGSLEINVAILAASIPIFWPVVKHFGFFKITVVNEVTVESEPRAQFNTRERSGSGASIATKSETRLSSWDGRSRTDLFTGKEADVELQRPAAGTKR
jgi:hypothetical protein